MNTIQQQATEVFVNHNPDLEKCAWEKCGDVLFGPCILCTITESNDHGSKERKWLLCSPKCYAEFDKWFEEIYLQWAGDDHVATIDGGMPDEWSNHTS